jgi:hypothetical protein
MRRAPPGFCAEILRPVSIIPELTLSIDYPEVSEMPFASP